MSITRSILNQLMRTHLAYFLVTDQEVHMDVDDEPYEEDDIHNVGVD